MKNLSLLTWLTQLGLSVAVPPTGFVLLSVWLRNQFQLGVWVVIAGVVMGVIFALHGLIRSLQSMDMIANKQDQEEPPVSFNEHH